MPSSVQRHAALTTGTGIYEANDHCTRRAHRRRPSSPGRLGGGACDDRPLTGDDCESRARRSVTRISQPFPVVIGATHPDPFWTARRRVDEWLLEVSLTL